MIDKLVTVLKYLTEASLGDWSGRWHHYTDVNKIGVNPKQFHQDPAGVYLFPEEFEPEGSLWKKKKFLYTIEIKPTAKILDIGALGEEGKIEFANDLGVEITKEDFKGEYFDNRSYWDLLKNKYLLQKNAPGAARWSKDIMRLGYDAIFDDEKTLHVAEVQLLVLNPKVIQVIDVEERSGKRGIFKKIQDHQKLVAEHLEQWGKVKSKTPRKKKGYYGDPDYLMGEVHAEKGDAYLDWQISVENEQMMRISVVDANKTPSGYSLGSLVKNYDKKDIQKIVERATAFVSTVEAALITTLHQVVAREKLTWSNLTFENWLKSVGFKDAEDLTGQWGYHEIPDFEADFGHKVDPADFTDEDDDLDEFEYQQALENEFVKDAETRFDDWIHKLKRLKNPVVLYRAVCLDSLDDLDRDNIGVYWSDNYDSAQCYAAYNRNQKYFTLKAEVPLQDIDISFTLWNNLNPTLGEDEQEINILPNTKIQVVDIETEGDDGKYGWQDISFIGNSGKKGGK